jgi:hypothetical protein
MTDRPKPRVSDERLQRGWNQERKLRIEAQCLGQKHCDERDRLAERVKELEQERDAGLRREYTEREWAKSQGVRLAMAIEALEKVRAWDLREMASEHVGLSPDESKCVLMALAATADAGKWLEQHDAAVREEVAGYLNALGLYAGSDAIRARGKK